MPLEKKILEKNQNSLKKYMAISGNCALRIRKRKKINCEVLKELDVKETI